MIKVVLSYTARYKNLTYKPYTPFLIDDNDKEKLVNMGATIIEEKAVNQNKVKEAKAETKSETKREV